VIGSDCSLNGKFELLGEGNLIELGQKTTSFNIFLGAYEQKTAIKIGKDCMFSGWIDIRTGDSHAIVDELGQRVNPARDIFIGDHVWIGQRVILLKGAQVGQNSVVGAGSIVTGKSFPANSVLAGIPAKVVKTEVTWVR
jgi:acyl-[acyl carrier protein]--UDP-N-acetylglucosamine O-acyltransferase